MRCPRPRITNPVAAWHPPRVLLCLPSCLESTLAGPSPVVVPCLLQVVLSTDIAETSITLNDAVYVIDSCK